ncbi:MAG: transcriptional regulator [Bacteroidetes bacterium]|nr:MAG: transcriptional regulator [Bacteroidota bacterium]
MNEINLDEFANRSGIALTVIRKIEQGKTNLNLDSVNQVLAMFGHEMVPIDSRSIDSNNIDYEKS